MNTVFALLCFVVVKHWLIFPYPSGLLHWHCGNLTIAPVPAKQPWWIWNHNKAKHNKTVCIFLGIYCIGGKLYSILLLCYLAHDDVIKWKHFSHYWSFVRGIHRSTVNSPHKGQWRRALMFSLIRVCINDWVNNHEAGDLRRHRGHYDVNVMESEACALSSVLALNVIFGNAISQKDDICCCNMHHLWSLMTAMIQK